LQQLAALSFENKIPRLAKADHVIWKKRLADMAVGRARLNADELSDHHSCRLGKWYYGEASRPYRSHPAFAPLERPHELVHEHGKRAAKLFEKGDFAGALKEIEQVGPPLKKCSACSTDSDKKRQKALVRSTREPDISSVIALVASQFPT